jgi:hypothetical protein
LIFNIQKKINEKGCKYLRQPAVSFLGTPGIARRAKENYEFIE